MMKQTKGLLLIPVLFALSLFLFSVSAPTASAREYGAAKEIAPKSEPKVMAPTVRPKPKPCPIGWLPKGSRAKKNPDGSVIIKLPRGYQALPFDDVPAARYRSRTSLSLTCTCKNGSGDCSPVVIRGDPFCAMGSACKSCDQSNDAMIVRGDKIGYASRREARSLPAGSPTDFSRVKEIRQRLNKFLKVKKLTRMPSARSKGNGFIAPKGYVFTPLKVYGYVIYVLAPAEQAQARRLVTAVAFKCNCLSGSSGCTKLKKIGAYGCEAEQCNSCNLDDKFMGVGKTRGMQLQ